MKIFFREKDFKEAIFEHDEKIRRMEMIERSLCENAELKERIIILEQRLDALENGNRGERKEPKGFTADEWYGDTFGENNGK